MAATETTTASSNGDVNSTSEQDLDAQCLKDWGFDLRDTYRHAMKFYKGKNRFAKEVAMF